MLRPKMAANGATNSQKIFFFFNFKISGAQPVCRKPCKARVFSAFDFLYCFLLLDEAVEPYLQRHPYTFEVQERVMPGATQVRPLLLIRLPETNHRITVNHSSCPGTRFYVPC